MKVRTAKVIELTDEVAGKSIRRHGLSLFGRLELEADIILYNGRVIKNKWGPIFTKSKNREQAC